MRPDIEELKRTLKRHRAQYIPIVELGIHPTIKEKFLDKPIKTLKDDVEFWHKTGYDYIKLQPGADFNPAKVGLSGKVTHSEDGRFSRKWASGGKGVITGLQDYVDYKFPAKTDFDFSNFEQVKEYLPDGMGVIGQYGDIFTMTWDLMGFESFSFALFNDPELVQLLVDRIGGLVLSMFEYFSQQDVVDILWYSDDIAYSTGLMVSPQVLRRYFFPWLRKIGDLAAASGKPFIYHSDGRLFDIFDDIIACGVDAIHPIEPKAMEIAEVKQKVGHRLALIGNIDVDLLSRGSPDEVRAQVIKNIETVGRDGGYCAGSGNSIPEYVKYENYLAMIRTVRELSPG